MKLDRFITRPVLSTVISILVVILGVLGLVSLPIEQYPNMAPPTIMVRAAYTGANSQTVLNSVLAPLEESINGVEGMTYMTSSATNDGSASIVYRYPLRSYSRRRPLRRQVPYQLCQHQRCASHQACQWCGRVSVLLAEGLHHAPLD